MWKPVRQSDVTTKAIEIKIIQGITSQTPNSLGSYITLPCSLCIKYETKIKVNTKFFFHDL